MLILARFRFHRSFCAKKNGSRTKFTMHVCTWVSFILRSLSCTISLFISRSILSVFVTYPLGREIEIHRWQVANARIYSFQFPLLFSTLVFPFSVLTQTMLFHCYMIRSVMYIFDGTNTHIICRVWASIALANVLKVGACDTLEWTKWKILRRRNIK